MIQVRNVATQTAMQIPSLGISRKLRSDSPLREVRSFMVFSEVKVWDCPAAESTRLGIEFNECLKDGECDNDFDNDEQHGFDSEVVVLFCICRVSTMGH